MPPLAAVLALILLTMSSGAQAASWLDRLFGNDDDAGSEETSKPAIKLPLDIEGGLREALVVGSERVVARLGGTDGFNGDPLIRIALPASLAKARGWLEKVGLEAQMDEFETRMNRAAEAAAPKARALFVKAITEMNIQDATTILKGGDTAATDYLRERMTPDLKTEMRPVIDGSLADVGALQLLDVAMVQYQRIPFAPAVDVDVSDYVSTATVDGIFRYLAEEEKAIRADPKQRTTELLKSVFAEAIQI